MALIAAPLAAHAANSARIQVRPVVQQHVLDCEAAALQIALSAVGITASQNQLLGQFGADLRPPVLTNGNPTRWGDPYQTFVGDVDGQFVTTGYGVYYPPVVDAATRLGAAATGGEGWQPSTLYAAVAAGHPVMVWAPHLMRRPSVGQWTAWDGRPIWYSHSDHTQVLVGYDYDASTVTVADPLDGQIHSFSMTAFESAFAAFHRMAVVITTGGSSVAEAVSPVNDSVNVAAIGPNHSLYFYWSVGGTWYGPLGLNGPNTTYSAPAIVSEGDGNFDIAVEGPAHTLWVYWDIGGRWYGPLQVGNPGTTFSTPSMVLDSNNHVIIAASSPNAGAYLYWCIAGQWYGPAGVGSGNSVLGAPSLSLSGGASPTLQLMMTGANAELQRYVQQPDSSWSGAQTVVGAGSTYSATATVQSSSLFEGPHQSLDLLGPGQALSQLGGPGSTSSAPSVSALGSNAWAITQGGSHTLYFYWSGGNWNGPMQAAGAGSAYSAPSMAVQATGVLNVAVEGPADTLWFYWNIAGQWYGPVQPGNPGTTFSSIP